MTDLANIKVNFANDSACMEMFLGSVSTTGTMNQDMFMNKQETMDRAYDCCLQVTLSISLAEEIH